jgi:predicted transposase/invertase (TIGR01784 family)
MSEEVLDREEIIEEAESKLINHDSFLKKALENPMIAQSFFNQHLPEEVKRAVDLQSLKLEKESFIEDNLKKKISDILFSIDFKGAKGYFYILLEHQSTVDHFMTQRLFNYMNGIWQRHRLDNPKSKQLPLIYPIIFYNGSKKYTAPRSFFDLFHDKEMARKFLNDPVNVINVNEVSDSEFKEYPEAGIIEFFMKKHHERDVLRLFEEVKEIWDSLEFITVEQKESLMTIILWYNVSKIENNKDKHKIIDFVNYCLNVEGDKIMGSITTEWLREGYQKGIQQGIHDGLQKGIKEGLQQGMQRGTYIRNIEIAKSMLAKDLSISLIAEVTDLTEYEILALKSA